MIELLYEKCQDIWKSTKKYVDIFISVIKLFLIAAVISSPFAAWFTHVVTCIQTEAYIFLIAGAVCFPIGIVHGFMIWFGWA